MIIFNEAQTLGYSTKFNYLGNAFNYNNSSTLRVKGRLQSDKVFDSSIGSYFGIAYVGAYNGTTGWFPMGSSGQDLTISNTPTISGDLSFESEEAYLNLINGLGSVTNEEYPPLYDTWDGMKDVKNQYGDFQEIFLNGLSLGSGRVTKINFPESKDTRVQNYEAEIQLYKEGNMANLTGQNYRNITFDLGFCQYVSSLSENFNLVTDKEGGLSYSRSLNFNYVDSNLSESSLLEGVKAFASGIIYNDPAFQATLRGYPSFYQDEGSRYFTESYDNINGSYSFSEKFQGPTSGQKYKWTNNLSTSLGGEGPSSVTEKGKIVGVRKNILDSAYEGLSDVELSSLARVNEFYSAYNNNPSGLCSSGLFLKSKNRSINQEDGSIEYVFQYSNDPFSNNAYNVSRDIQLSRADNGIYTISEKGSVSNVSETTQSGRLNKSIQYFNNSISGEVYGRIFDYFSNEYSGCGCPSGTGFSQSELRKISSEATYSEFEGSFAYSYVYRNDCTSLQQNKFLVTSERNVTDAVHSVFLGVTPYNGQIAQKQNTSPLVADQRTITVISQTTGETIDGYLNAAISNLNPPNSDTYFMNSANYNFDPDNSILSLSVGYNYTGYREYSDYNV